MQALAYSRLNMLSSNDHTYMDHVHTLHMHLPAHTHRYRVGLVYLELRGLILVS